MFVAGREHSDAPGFQRNGEITVEQPGFRANRVNGMVTLVPGITALIGVFRDPAKEQRVGMVTVTVHRRERK